MRKRKKSLVTAMALLVTAVLVCMLAVQAVFLVRYYRSMEEKAVDSLDAIARQAQSALGYELESIHTSGVSIFRNERITGLLRGAGAAGGSVIALEELLGLNSSLAALFLTDLDWEPVASSAKGSADSAAALELYSEALELWDGGVYVTPEYSDAVAPAEDGTVYFAYLQPVLYRPPVPFSEGEPGGDDPDLIGYAVFICDLNSLSVGEAGGGAADYELIVCHEGSVVACSSGELREAVTGGGGSADLSRLAGSRYISESYAVHNGEWTVVSVADKALITRDIFGMTAQAGMTIFLVTVAAVALAVGYLSKNMLRPIKRMERELMIVSEPDPSRRLTEAPDNEIGEISGKINLMLERLDEARRSARNTRASCC